MPVISGSLESSVVTVSIKVINKRVSFRVIPIEIITPSKLRQKLFEEFGSIISDTETFDIGYYKGQQKLWIRNDSDIRDAWKHLLKGAGSFWLHSRVTQSDHDDDFAE